ncbi:MAG: mannose-1-phosphate guanylyltransferase [Peptococcaceae bacterium]|nr:mannose-1-phosphate guanylyltransferase [Peptococcaceae bacterium]
MDAQNTKAIDHSHTYAVIMAGGTGSRFWPKSRLNRPKQLLSFCGSETLLRETATRILPLIKWSNIFVVTNHTYKPLIVDELPDLPTQNIILEPENKDTAACIGLTAIKLLQFDPEALMVCMPADHFVRQNESFCHTIEQAVALATTRECMVTIGIPPNSPKTNFGYIKRGNRLTLPEVSGQVFSADQFLEKPSRQRAISLLKAGNYLWNSGIFIWRAATILQAIERYMPKLGAGLARIASNYRNSHEDRVIADEYSRLQAMSIDYGIMERATDIYVIPGNFQWEDLGSWSALENILAPDTYGNVANGQHLGLDTVECIIDTDGKLVATLGVRNLIIINTNDAVLVCAKDRDQDIKTLVQGLCSADYSKYR